MAMNFKIGQFTTTGGNGNQAVTGVGFQPKALILFGTQNNGLNTFMVTHFGAAISPSVQRSIIDYGNHGASAGDNAVGNATTIYHRRNFAGGVASPVGSLVSFDADGFTINWDFGVTAWVASYMAFGGADLTNVDLRTVTVPGATGSQAVTGLGFQPDALIAFGVSHTSATGGRDTDPLSSFIGMTDGTTQAVNCAAGDEGADPTNTLSVQDTGRLVLTINAAGTPSVHNEASLTSLDADGYTFNWITRTASDVFFVLAFKGGSFKVGVGAYKTSTGTQAYTGVGFQPKGVMFMSNGEAAG